MGLGRVFKKIGDGFLTVGKIIADVADIPFAEELIAFVPVVGPALSIAMKYVDEAEKKFSEPKSGKVKMAWALHNTRSALLEVGVEEKRILGLLELALLLIKGEALLGKSE